MRIEYKYKVIQAYADDFLIFSDDKDKMNELVSSLSTLMRFGRINFSSEKCKVIINNPTDEIIPEITLPNEKSQKILIQACQK
jgi:hypothetical protein